MGLDGAGFGDFAIDGFRWVDRIDVICGYLRCGYDGGLCWCLGIARLFFLWFWITRNRDGLCDVGSLVSLVLGLVIPLRLGG